MNHQETERRFADRMKNKYPSGTRIELIALRDPYTTLKPGTRGTVFFVDDLGIVFPIWDNGRRIGVIPGEDDFRRLTLDEIVAENCEIHPTSLNTIDFAAKLYGLLPDELGYRPNAAGTGYINTLDTEYSLIEVLGQPALFTDKRLHLTDIPEGTYLYHFRDSDTGEPFATVERNVGVNHGGSIITKKPIDFGNRNYVPLTDETSPNFIGEDISLNDFISAEFDIEQYEITM